jgi:opacity protein-like surface antigen
LKFGIVDCNSRVLAYLKAGASYAKSKEWFVEWYQGNIDVGPSTNELSTVTPIVALGLEKACGKKTTCRLELEYKFNKSKSKYFSAGDYTKLTQKDAITLRALVCYNVKI